MRAGESDKPPRGLYVVVEGQDGTGKSTQVAKLADYFCALDRETVVINEGAEVDSGLPSTDAIGKIIHAKKFALDGATNLLLFTTARIELWQKRIVPALERDAVVLASRNYFSTLAYQHFGEGVPRELIENLTRQFLPERYLSPDKSVILVLDDAERARRMRVRSQAVAADTFDSREADFFDKVNRGYEKIARDLALPIIDAGGSVDEVFAKIKAALEI